MTAGEDMARPKPVGARRGRVGRIGAEFVEEARRAADEDPPMAWLVSGLRVMLGGGIIVDEARAPLRCIALARSEL